MKEKMTKLKRIWNFIIAPFAIVLAKVMPNYFEWAIVECQGKIVDDMGSPLLGDRTYLKQILNKDYLVDYYKQKYDSEIYLVLSKIRSLKERQQRKGIWK